MWKINRHRSSAWNIMGIKSKDCTLNFNFNSIAIKPLEGYKTQNVRGCGNTEGWWIYIISITY